MTDPEFRRYEGPYGGNPQGAPAQPAPPMWAAQQNPWPGPFPVGYPTAPRRRRGWLLGVIGVALLLILAVGGTLGWQWWQRHEIAQERLAAQNAAVDFAQVLLSIDYRHVDDDFRAVLNGSTGEFKDSYQESSGELRQVLIQNKAVAHGVVKECRVLEFADDRAVVELDTEQTVENTKLPAPRLDRTTLTITMEKVDGRWLAGKVEITGSKRPS